MKKIISVLLAVCLAFVPCAAVIPVSADDGLADSGLCYTESTAMLKNPLMGYPICGSLQFSDTMPIRNDTGFAWYYVNLNYYSAGNSLYESSGGKGKRPVGGADIPISQTALDRFEETLYNLRMNGSTCLLRFVYDWNGTPGCEPTDFEMILTHIKQLCDLVSRYSDVVYGFECGIIGVFGEMHSSNYCGKEYANRIIDTYIHNTPDTMTLMVRSPTYILNYLGLTREELATYVPKEGSVPYRLSYFNDGYMNTAQDTGTWYNRAVDLKFLEKASEHNSYGGEYGSAYSTEYLPNSACVPENAIPEMYRTHVNFIRGNVYKIGGNNQIFGYDQFEYTDEYEEDWFPDNSAFYGSDCHTFITAHLGYRLVLRKSLLSSQAKAGGELHLKGVIENTGFANVLTRPTAQVLLVRDGYLYKTDVDIQAYDIKSCTKYDYDMTFALPSNMPEGDYRVFLRFSTSTTCALTEAASGLQFANDEDIYYSDYGANILGTVYIAKADTVSSAASERFVQLGSALPGANTHDGAPLLSGYGMPGVSANVTVTYNAGDRIELESLNKYRSDDKVTYKWYKNSKLYSSDEKLTIESAALTDAGEYYVSVTSGGKRTTTAKITVVITEHKFGKTTVVRAAACHSSGVAERKCSDCGIVEKVILPPLEHVAGEAETVPSTCTVEGSVSKKCTLCDDVLSLSLLDLAEHDYVDEIREPTCTREGTKNSVCANCGHTETQSIPAKGHRYVYKLETGAVIGVCVSCGDTYIGSELDGSMSVVGIGKESFTNSKGAYDVNDDIVLIGEGGYLESYETQTPAAYITFLFRATGIETPVDIGKFRMVSYPKGQPNNLRDSNNMANYYGDCLFRISEDGLWAFTLNWYLMNAAGSSFGGVVWAAFNDPDSTKGNKFTVNVNDNAKIELVGIYEGKLSGEVAFVDEDGAVLEYAKEEYHTGSYWSNSMYKVATAEELYQGDVLTKAPDTSYIYTFSHWAYPDGTAADGLLTKSVLHPVFDAEENRCSHEKTEKTVTKEATCTSEGSSCTVCADCSAIISVDEKIPMKPHEDGNIKIIVEPTFKVSGEQKVFCAGCHMLLRTEAISPVKNKFSDVNIGAWYSDAVSYAVYHGLFSGTSETTFAPNTNMTRAMFVTVLGRLDGAPDNRDAKTAFTDVKTGQYYSGYIAWAAENKIVSGMSPTTFAPNANITREEMCVMIKNYCEYAGIALVAKSNPKAFLDSGNISKWALNAVEICQRSTLITGKLTTESGSYFDPKGQSTRAEVATVLKNLCLNFE